MMTSTRPSRLRFNIGFLLEASLGTSRDYEINYPSIMAEDLLLEPLMGKISFTRTSEGIYIDGRLQSSLKLECVRCLEDAIVPIKFRISELYYYPASSTPKGELAVPDTAYIDMSPVIRDLCLLEAPMKPLCQPDCQGLCLNCGQNLNLGSCDCDEDDIDPRMAVLKKLLDPKKED